MSSVATRSARPRFYFAYGSNMLPSVLVSTVPAAENAGPARVADHRLRFSRDSQRWRAGAADLVPARGLRTWGRLYEIDPGVDLHALETREGVEAGAYEYVELRVDRPVGTGGRDMDTVDAFTYTVRDRSEHELVPAADYMDLVLAGAAAEPCVPEEYRAFLAHLADCADRARRSGGRFRSDIVLHPTSARTGRGAGPLLISPELSWWQAPFRRYAEVRVGDRRMLVRVRGRRRSAPAVWQADQVVRKQLSGYRNVDTYGYDAAVSYVSTFPTLRPVRPRTTVLEVSRPAVADSEKNIAVVHPRPLELIGLQPGGFVTLRTTTTGRRGRPRVSRISVRAFSGSDDDLSHVGRPVYPTDREVAIDSEIRARLGAQAGDGIWVSASAIPLLRERLFYYAVTTFLGIAALKPVLEEAGAGRGPSFAVSAGATVIVTFVVAVAELRQRIGAS